MRRGKCISIRGRLDGVYRNSNTSSHHLQAGARGSWVSERDSKVDYREAAANKSWHYTLRFDGDSALWTITESTGLIDDIQIKAKARGSEGPPLPRGTSP